MSERSRNIFLAASLALNVFIAGAAIGGASMWQASRFHNPAMAIRGRLERAAVALPQNERKDFRQRLIEARRQAAADIEAAKAGRIELGRLMTADPLDRQAIERQLATVRQSDLAVRARLEQAIVDFAASLTPAERKEFVEGLHGNGELLRGIKANSG